MNRKEIVVPRASWRDVFLDGPEKALIPGTRRLLWSHMGPAAMHLTGSPLLSKEWGEVHLASEIVLIIRILFHGLKTCRVVLNKPDHKSDHINFI